MRKNNQTGTNHILLFAELSSGDFERLCLWLLQREGYENVDHIGASGSDNGCDILGVSEGRTWFCQCKRVKRFGPREVGGEIKKILEELIADEPKRKPLTDEALSKALKDKGYPIARRTVAKYRESMAIPPSRR